MEMSHHDVISGALLRSRGVTKGELATLLRRQHLFRAHRDVYFTTDRPTQRGIWLAAVLHCGKGALLGFESAAVLRQILRAELGRPHVVVAHRRITKPPASIRVHRSRTLRDEDYDVVDDIPVTSLFRTYDDLARRVSDRTLKAALRDGEYRYNLDVAELRETSRTPRLRRFLAAYVPGQGKGESEAERLFLELRARSTLPAPEGQRKTAGGRVDFLWPQLGLIVEIDGYAAHRGRIAHRDDLRRDRQNLRTGRITLRFAWGDLSETPGEVVADLNNAHRLLLGSPWSSHMAT